MKKKSLIVLVSTVFFMLSATCYALDMDRMQLGPKAGLHIPVGDYGDAVNTGFTFGGQLKIPVNPNLSVGGHLTYSLASDRVDVSMIEIYPFVDFYVARGQADFFLRGAMGFNWWDAEFSGTHYWWGEPVRYKVSDDGIDLMIALGGGLNFMQNWEAVLLYNRILTGDFDEGYFTLTLGYNFDLK